MRGAASRSDDHAQAARMRLFRIREHLVRRPVGGDDPHLVRHGELLEQGDGRGEDREVAGAAHDDADEVGKDFGRSGHRANMAGGWLPRRPPSNRRNGTGWSGLPPFSKFLDRLMQSEESAPVETFLSVLTTAIVSRRAASGCSSRCWRWAWRAGLVSCR
ncbi:MAG: hypothetical protein U5K74_13280 [Gemmatimonadaceae bacterium]|nr:hypothetical protein [Gemmatimonadaceae bacterium]